MNFPKTLSTPAFALLALVLPGSLLHAAPVSLFNGKTLEGWEGDTKVWRVEDGAIVGGSLEGNPQNEFLAAKKTYRNFRLKFEYKLVGTEGFVNGGVQFRSKRIPSPPNEMSGYQADIGAGYTGFLYDESRRKKMLAEGDKAKIAEFEKPGDWNKYEIRAEGPRITLIVNGRQTVDYSEPDGGIDKEGLIALQIHGKCKAVISYRNITIEELAGDVVPEQSQILQRFGDPAMAGTPPEPFKDGKFELKDNEVIVFAGQTNLVREQKAGELEALLASAFADKKPRFRSMAWEGDTVYEQWRDLNFGSWKGQLESAGATTVVAQFGQVESFDGADKVPAFMAAYHKLLDEFAGRTHRLVLVSPMPFEKPVLPYAPDLTRRNADVKAYADAVRAIAKQRGAVFVDLFTTEFRWPRPDAPRLTDNGMHLNAHGLRFVAGEIAKALGVENRPQGDLAALRAAIVEKNRLFFDCWRPANWSFVYGDRVAQLFGKPGGDAPSLRESFEYHKPFIATYDERIQALARGETSTVEPPKGITPVALPDSPEFSPEAEQATFTLAEGYEASLFASEKNDIIKPTQMSWDEKGRLYVACSPTYPHVLAGTRPGDFILICEDTDHDGKVDKTTRFAEGLTMVQGVEPGDGGVYVCDFDELVHLRDTDGDGKADERRVIFSGFGVGDTHQLVNSITHGMDGTLWFTQGLHAFSRVETPWGLSRLDKAGVWRLNPRTLRLDGFFNGGMAGHNCWGVAFDDYGQIFHKSGDRPDGYYTTPGTIRVSNPDQYHGIGSLFKTNPKTTALDIIGTAALPDEVQGCAVIGGYFGNVLEFHRFVDDGSGFVTEQLPKLLKSSSTAFRPVDVSVGPDGAIYVADWYNPVIGHYQASYADPRRDRTRGRIWRITAKGRPPVKQPDLASMKVPQLLDQLLSKERWTRYQAKRLLFDLPANDVLDAAHDWLEKLDAASPGYEHALLELVGVYQAHMVVRVKLLDKLLAAKDARVRAYGARVIGDWAGQLPDALGMLAKCVRDENARVRLEAIVALSYVAKPEAVEVAALALDSPRDRFIDYALVQCIRALKPQWGKPLADKRLTFGGSAAHLAFVHKIADAAPVQEHPGKIIYDALCLNCHQPDGNGLPGIYPPLRNSEWVKGDKEALIKMLMHGLVGPITVAGQEYGRATPIPMPPSGLNDQQIAEVLTYVRKEHGAGADTVAPAEVQAVRAKHRDRAALWTLEELKKP